MLSFHQLFPALKQTSDQLQTHTHTHTHTRAPGEAGRRDLPPAPPSPRRRRRRQHLGLADSAPPSGAALLFGFPSCILRRTAGPGSCRERGLIAMEYFMVPTQKVPSLQHFRKTEKEVIGGLCRCVLLLPPFPSYNCSPGPASSGGRACAHAWPAPPTPFAFLSCRGGCSPALRSCAVPVSYTHLTLPTRRDSCRSRWSPYH